MGHKVSISAYGKPDDLAALLRELFERPATVVNNLVGGTVDDASSSENSISRNGLTGVNDAENL